MLYNNHMDIEKAKELLTTGYTCVLVKGTSIKTSKANGIAPMLCFIDNNEDLEGYSAADKIVGKAAAMLFTKAKVAEVYAEVLSKSGEAYLKQAGIKYSYKTLTDTIINRMGTDICPMEKTVKDIDDIEEAYRALQETYTNLTKKPSI